MKKIAIYGLVGSYTYQATQEVFSKIKIKVEMKEFPIFSDFFNFIKKGNLGFLPIENSNGGTVTLALDLFPEYDFEILGEYYFPVNHYLLAKQGVNLKKIKEVYSHPQALAQCSRFLDKNKIKPISFSDTAVAGKFISENNFTDKAAIGSKSLAEIYNLKILKNNFQNSKNNVTRFLLIKKRGDAFKVKVNKSKKYKTSILFETRHIPGVLYKCLGGFATNGINLTKIESRPSKQKKNFEPFFFVEFEGYIKDKNVKLALEELEFYTQNIKILGSYQKI